MKALDRSFESISIGDTASMDHRVTEAAVRSFAAISGDYNPLHMNEAYAAKTPFGGRVVHGMFLGALVSGLVGMQLPGQRALLMKESLEFKKPVHIDDMLRIEAIVAAKSEATRILELKISITVAKTVVAEGVVHARVLKDSV